MSHLLDRYDEDCVEAAEKLAAKLARTTSANAASLICAALKEYACEHDKRITESEWAQKYREACEKIGAMLEVFHMARDWGIAGKGFESSVALSIAKWVDGECCGPLPQLPEHLK